MCRCAHTLSFTLSFILLTLVTPLITHVCYAFLSMRWLSLQMSRAMAPCQLPRSRSPHLLLRLGLQAPWLRGPSVHVSGRCYKHNIEQSAARDVDIRKTAGASQCCDIEWACVPPPGCVLHARYHRGVVVAHGGAHHAARSTSLPVLLCPFSKAASIWISGDSETNSPPDVPYVRIRSSADRGPTIPLHRPARRRPSRCTVSVRVVRFAYGRTYTHALWLQQSEQSPATKRGHATEYAVIDCKRSPHTL